MSAAFSNHPVNPFSSYIVKEPRDCGCTVESLNQESFDALIRAFTPLQDGAIPHLNRKADCAELVLSPDPGYGKSHLIGRLFQRLDDDATLVYLTAFQSPSLAWQSILDHVVNELDYPDSSNPAKWTPDEPTQLNAFSQRVIKNLIASGLQHGALTQQSDRLPREHWEPAAKYVTTSSDVDMRFGSNEWSRWIRENFNSELLTLCGQELDRHFKPHRINLNSHNSDWLQVLFCYATSPSQSPVRERCIAWLRGEITTLGEAGEDQSSRELEVSEINALCQGRLSDLCQLAAYYRPFLFCMDQTEDYVGNAERLSEFGRVVAWLVNFCPNQLTVVTANQTIWDQISTKGFDKAHRERFSTPPLSLRGLTRRQAEEFIQKRFAQYGVEVSESTRFISGGWLESVFVSENKEISIREFIHLCRQRWDHYDEKALVKAVPATPNAVSLAELFAQYKAEFEANPKWLEYSADDLRWLVREPLSLAAKTKCHSHEHKKGYVELEWELPGNAALLFGFMRESEWRPWKGIAELAKQWRDQHPGQLAKVVYFRTQELGEIPKSSWTKTAPLIREARNSYLDLIELGPKEVAELFAARDLYAEANQGNEPPYTGPAVVEFLSKALAHWVKRIVAPIQSDAFVSKKNEPPPKRQSSEIVELARRIIEVVKIEKFIAIDTLLAKLGIGISREMVFAATDGIPQVQKMAHPQSVFFIWQE